MTSLSSYSDAQKNKVQADDSAKISENCTIEFKTFFNGTGGTDNSVIIGKNCNLKFLKISIQGIGNTLSIDDDCSFNGAINIAITGTNRTVKIGKNCTINGMFLNCRDQDILIGDDCLFSNEIKIRSSDAHKIFDSATKTQINLPHSPVTIGNHVWIGQGAFIGKNAKIPDGCVVGTRAVITKQFEEANCILGGMGGKILRHGIYWEK